MNKLIVPKYCDANSILLVNQVGSMRKLYCPFRVRFIGNTNDFERGVFLWVEEVATNQQGVLIFVTLNRQYPHTHLTILPTFQIKGSGSYVKFSFLN